MVKINNILLYVVYRRHTGFKDRSISINRMIEKIYKQKPQKTRVAILISKKTDYKATKSVARDEEKPDK